MNIRSYDAGVHRPQHGDLPLALDGPDRPPVEHGDQHWCARGRRWSSWP